MIVKDFLKLKKFPRLNDNLETDLGLDSLSKLEFLSSLEKKYDMKISDEEASGAFTLEDIKRLVSERSQVKMALDEVSLEDKILVSPDPPLEKHVSTGKNPLAILARLFFHLLCNPFYTPKVFSEGGEQGNLIEKHLKVLASFSHLPPVDIVRSYAKQDSATRYGEAKEAIVLLVVSFVSQVIKQEQEKNTLASCCRAFIRMKNSARLFLQNNMQEELKAFCQVFATQQAFCGQSIPWDEFP